ncbi:hydroxyphenylacetyl-CoA thioesterase PaaI [Bacillus suaedaesalsae]|uniref:Hydroxyphenylacetyl-CoA thioesterase PaaI n=1 Tax=Bacillus suaedaesalsae TaxID=2810349 RepID=A0ABS2DJ35_9BACI|nr:hydroxyphenylacetyl-CoA thioesterase PaaI [Bacillus suaedaesalsae]MBM6618015.1 hydroxyphenylacetyl-CoA thioesterase PaaI [Bacillus suaedaesalsae]
MLKQNILDRVQADPYAKFLGIEVVDLNEGFAEVTMTVQDSMLNFHGAANGGVIFSLADVAFAIASNSYGQTAVGINVNVNYMTAGKLGDKLTATATEITKNPKLGLYRMVVMNQDGDLLASLEGMVYRKKEQFA